MGLPAHPETNKVAPLDCAFGSDGNLYIADCQAFAENISSYTRWVFRKIII